jgi:hypothetical protein
MYELSLDGLEKGSDPADGQNLILSLSWLYGIWGLTVKGFRTGQIRAKAMDT